MPKFYEVYGNDVNDKSPSVIAERELAYCPFTESTCDGGGNRHQTKIRLEGSALRAKFSPELTSVIPGVCSIEYGNEVWIVCPRRLLGFNASSMPPRVNQSLKDHEKAALINVGLPLGVELGVWSEVYLQYGDDNSSINYHFDFVISPISRGISFDKLLESYKEKTESEIDELKKAAKIGKYLSGRYVPGKPVPILPNLASPIIIEVMTASTSGSDTEAGTDIASAFTDAILGKNHNCPGINKRQVWGRMATQLFAKSALAEGWGGKTVWLVQDQLLKNIELTTKLKVENTKDENTKEAHNGTVNFLSMGYTHGAKGVDSVKFRSYSAKSAGLSFEGNKECTDILLPKMYPAKMELLKSVLRRELSAIIKL